MLCHTIHVLTTAVRCVLAAAAGWLVGACMMVGRQVLEGAPGVQVVDDRAANQHPEPLLASNQENILVGRVRYDNTQGTPEDGYTGIEVSRGAVMT